MSEGKKLMKGDRIIVRLVSGEIQEGSVAYARSGPSWQVELYDIICHTTGNILDNLTYYRKDIEDIRYIVENESDSSSSQNDDSKTPDLSPSKTIKIPQAEFTRLSHMATARECLYINDFNKKYMDAVEALKHRESVGVVGLGSHFARRPLTLLAICDSRKVYVFDVFALRELKDLKGLMQSKKVMKVVHDGAALFDCLYHKHGVEMVNIFDTQVRKVQINKQY